MSDKRILSVYATAQKSLERQHRIPTVLEERIREEKAKEEVVKAVGAKKQKALILTLKKDKVEVPIRIKTQHQSKAMLKQSQYLKQFCSQNLNKDLQQLN